MNTGERLREERERLGLSQSALGEVGGVKKLAQMNYEKNERQPDSQYLAQIAVIGVDIRYVVTGERDGPPPLTLAADEEVLLDGYRAMDKATKKRMLAFVLGGEELKNKYSLAQVFNSGVDIGQHIQGDQTYHQPVTINVGGNKKKK